MPELDADRQSAVNPRRSSAGPWVLLAIVAAVGCVYLALFPSVRAMTGQHPAVGRTLPDLWLEPLTGDSEKLFLKDLHDQVVVLNFWGTWCPPCIHEFPSIATLWEQFKEHPDFRLLAVSCGQEGDDQQLGPVRLATERFLRAQHSQLPTYGDETAYTRRQVAMVLDDNSFAYPTTLVIDRMGVIRGVWQGEARLEDLQRLVQEVLDEPDPRVPRGLPQPREAQPRGPKS